MKLTDTNVATVRRLAKGKSDYIAWDDKLAGFGLRIRDGKATWIVQYKIGKLTRRMKLGTVEQLTAEQARKGWETPNGEHRPGAAKILVDAHDGHDAAAARAQRKRDTARTLGSVIERYLADKRPKVRVRTYAEIARYLTDAWKPLHNTPLVSITKEAVASRISAIAAGSGNSSANRARATLSGLFEWADGEGLCGLNPVLGTNSKAESDPRERTLSDDEIVRVWNALPDRTYNQIIKLLLLTGCRRDEIGALQWSEVDLAARTLTIPKERTKNNAEHVVPLSDPALEILSGIEQRGDFVFGVGGFVCQEAA